MEEKHLNYVKHKRSVVTQYVTLVYHINTITMYTADTIYVIANLNILFTCCINSARFRIVKLVKFFRYRIQSGE